MDKLLTFPPVSPAGLTPVWNNNSFKIGDEDWPILQYSNNLSGWNDELTSFHEENAGDNHFIDQASRQHAISQLAHIKNEYPTIVEIGCSSGHLIPLIQQALPKSQVIGADITYQSLMRLHQKIPHVPLLQFDLLHCPLPDNSVDAVILLNVLEHIENDFKAIEQVFRILKPNGIAIIEVPSGPELFDIYDKALLHFRRYSLSGLATLLSSFKFDLIKKSHLGFFLYPGFWLIKKRNKKMLANNNEQLHEEIIKKNIQSTQKNSWLKQTMKVELKLGKKINYPFGIRCLITCKKQSDD